MTPPVPMSPMNVPPTPQMVEDSIASLRARREVISDLCAALEEYLAYDVERQIAIAEFYQSQQAAHAAAAEQHAAQRRVYLSEMLVNAQASREQLTEQIASLNRMIDDKDTPPQSREYMDTMLRPELESKMKSLDDQIERLQAELDGKAGAGWTVPPAVTGA